MLADRALRVASDISADYNRFQILDLLRSAVAAGQSRGTSNYSHYVQQAVSGFREVLTGSTFKAYPPDLYDWLESKEFGPLLPIKIADRIITGFIGDPANHINANEVSSVLEAAAQLVTNCNGYIRFASALGVRIDEVSDGHISIDLKLPEDVFDGLFAGLIKSYQHFDRLFQLAAELSGTPRDSIFVSKTSSSTITAILMAAHDHYMAIISLYGGAVGAAVKTIQLYKTIADLRSSNVPEKVLAPVEASREEVRDAYIEEMLNKISERFDKIEEARKNEVKNELRISARYIVDDIINGARISLSIENFSETRTSEMQQKTIELEDKSILERIEEIRQLENKIDLVRNGDPETIRAITAQSNNKEDRSN